jgi:23S rRNA (guanosine2251-2'-O)-methyltransferase
VFARGRWRRRACGDCAQRSRRGHQRHRAKVASGAAETVPYFMVTNLARTLNELKERNIWITGTSDDAEKTLYDVDLKISTAWVLGAEGSGLRQLTRKTCDQLVSIPMAGGVESLNVSVASGICLYETVRQRRG